MQDEPQSITTPTTTTFTTASSHKIFNKNVINNESILLNDLAQNSASHLLNIDKYKLYVEQTEQTVTQLYKQIAKLTDVLRECKKIFQTQTQFEDMLADPLLSLAKCSYNKELSFVFEKLADLSRVSAENSKLFVSVYQTIV